MSKGFRWYTDIYVDEDEVREMLDIDEDVEVTNDDYYEAAHQKFLDDDCEYFDYAL